MKKLLPKILLGIFIFSSFLFRFLWQTSMVSAVVDTVEINSGYRNVPGRVTAIASDDEYVYVASNVDIEGQEDVTNVSLIRFSKSTGELDPEFSPELGDTDEAFSVDDMLIDDGYLYLAGSDLTVGEETGMSVVRIDLETGEVDESFVPNISQAFGVYAWSLAVDDGWLYVTGAGQLYDLGEGNYIDGLVRIDIETGQVDESFDAGLEPEAYELRIIGDYAYVSFYGSGYDLGEGNFISGLVRIDLNTGSVDTNFSIEAMDGEMYITDTEYLEGSLYVVGDFEVDLGDGVIIRDFVKIDPDSGEVDESVIVEGVDQYIEYVSFYDGYFYVTSDWETLGGVEYFTRIDSNTWEIDTAFDLEFNDAIREVYRDGDLLFIGGRFTQVNGTEISYLVALHVDVEAEPSPSPDSDSGSNSSSSSHHSSRPSSPKAPLCSDLKPAGEADLFQIDRSPNTATLYFTPVNGHVNKYHVVYGFSVGDERFGQVGSEVNHSTNNGVQSITIHDLDPRSTYWFKVVPVNGCAVGNWSNWLDVKPTTSQPIISYRWL